MLGTDLKPPDTLLSFAQRSPQAPQEAHMSTCHSFRQSTFVRQEKLLRAEDHSKSHVHPLLEPRCHKHKDNQCCHSLMQSYPATCGLPRPCIQAAEDFHTSFAIRNNSGYRLLGFNIDMARTGTQVVQTEAALCGQASVKLIPLTWIVWMGRNQVIASPLTAVSGALFAAEPVCHTQKAPG